MVLDLNQPGAPVVGSGTSASDGSWSIPNAKGLNIAVIFQGRVAGGTVRVSGLVKPDETGFLKSLNGQTDIACEAGVSAVVQKVISGQQVTGQLIAQLEQAAAGFVGTTNFLCAASVSAASTRRLSFRRHPDSEGHRDACRRHVAPPRNQWPNGNGKGGPRRRASNSHTPAKSRLSCP
jgi:hypothetical protein